ncbi:MAG TPA: ATP-grasp domain-containing protein [Gemmatimonadales bacterium]
MTDTGQEHLLIAGVAVRALAVSAARAGYKVTAVDAFGDLDLCRVAMVIPLRAEDGTGYSPLTAIRAARAVPAQLVAYTSNFENYPEAVARLADHRRLLGNPPAVLTRVRNPFELMRALRRRGFATPGTRATAPASQRAAGFWLLKPRRSGGGHGTRIWRRGESVPRTHYLQERIAGTTGSVVFAADGRRAVTLGLTRQLVGDGRLGARGFRYCGSLLGHPAGLFRRGEELLETARAIVAGLTAEFGLVGLNGIDFVARNGVPYPIEVNPRYSASMELLERAHGLSMFETHIQAFAGTLPAAPAPSASIEGKAIAFARRDVIMGDTQAWIDHGSFADIPRPGERIRRGHPICTVFARGRNPESCLRLLQRRAASVYRRVGAVTRGAA